MDVRIIAATNRDLKAEIGTGNFREDLYYRLNVFSIALPALRERRDDVVLLANHFLEQTQEEGGRPLPSGFSAAAMDALSRYDWPGNVRELQNEVQRAIVLAPASGLIEAEMLSDNLRAMDDQQSPRPWRREGKLKDVIGQVEREMIETAMETNGGNKIRVSEQLGISRYTLLQKLKDYGSE